jgi:class 3 adenylate cyclase
VDHGGRGSVLITFDELKPVTTLFADIVGSTALGEQLTPPVRYQGPDRGMREPDEQGRRGVRRRDPGLCGDGICPYFGAPVVHEDDPKAAPGRAADSRSGSSSPGPVAADEELQEAIRGELKQGCRLLLGGRASTARQERSWA